MVEDDPLMPEVAERAVAEERKMAADQAFADKLAKRLPQRRSSMPRLKRREGEPKPGRHALLRESMGAERTHPILMLKDIAAGSPTRSVPDQSISFIQC
jgi:hypothetical protein